MSEAPDETEVSAVPQAEFEKISAIVTAEFPISESLLEHGIPAYYLGDAHETKQPFLNVLKNLESMSLIPILRKMDGRIVLRVIPKPLVKPSRIWINWALFFATIATTFVTGYMISDGMLDQFVGGALFTVAIMSVLGMHEMGHKLTANRKGIDATPPYFIPGPPPFAGFLGIGTFGAVIMQKSLPPNKDSLFDIGANGPVVGFILAVITATIGFRFSTYTLIPVDSPTLPAPLLFDIIRMFVPPLGVAPIPSAGEMVAINLHPVAFAGWVGLLVTMLNLLPAAMLDGGHVARALIGTRARLVLTGFSILILAVAGFIPMALFVLFLAFYKHPGPLDDVSKLSINRKLFTVGLIVVFVLSSYLHILVLYLLQLFGF
jgi:membrane-associated protease RseP (regulator of RpoE activity)